MALCTSTPSPRTHWPAGHCLAISWMLTQQSVTPPRHEDSQVLPGLLHEVSLAVSHFWRKGPMVILVSAVTRNHYFLWNRPYPDAFPAALQESLDTRSQPQCLPQCHSWQIQSELHLGYTYTAVSQTWDPAVVQRGLNSTIGMACTRDTCTQMCFPECFQELVNSSPSKGSRDRREGILCSPILILSLNQNLEVLVVTHSRKSFALHSTFLPIFSRN